MSDKDAIQITIIDREDQAHAIELPRLRPVEARVTDDAGRGGGHARSGLFCGGQQPLVLSAVHQRGDGGLGGEASTGSGLVAEQGRGWRNGARWDRAPFFLGPAQKKYLLHSEAKLNVGELNIL